MKKLFLLILMTVSLISCVEDADNVPCFGCNQGEPEPDPTEYTIELRGESPSGQQNPLHILYYQDDPEGDITSVTIHSQTNTDIIESKNVMSFNQIGFRFNVENGGQAIINSVTIKEEESNQVIFENHNLNVAPGKIFMYVVSTNSYTVTN